MRWVFIIEIWYKIAYLEGGGLGNAAEYTLGLAHGMFLARANILAARKAGVLDEITVIVGFYDGDGIDLGVLLWP